MRTLIRRFVQYFKERGIHELVSIGQSTIGIFSLMLLSDTNNLIIRLSNGELNKDTFMALVGALLISLLKSICFTLSGNRALIRTSQK